MLINIVYAAEKIAETANEHGAETGLLASLGINSSLFFFQLINFAVVVFILWFLILKPLTKKLAERQKITNQGLIDAQKAAENAIKSAQNYQEKIVQAKKESDNILNLAVYEAKALAEQIKQQTKVEIEKLAAQAKSNLSQEKEKMLSEVKIAAAELVTMAVGKILEEKIDADKNKKMIEDTLKKIKVKV